MSVRSRSVSSGSLSPRASGGHLLGAGGAGVYHGGAAPSSPRSSMAMGGYPAERGHEAGHWRDHDHDGWRQGGWGHRDGWDRDRLGAGLLGAALTVPLVAGLAGYNNYYGYPYSYPYGYPQAAPTVVYQQPYVEPVYEQVQYVVGAPGGTTQTVSTGTIATASDILTALGYSPFTAALAYDGGRVYASSALVPPGSRLYVVPV